MQYACCFQSGQAKITSGSSNIKNAQAEPPLCIHITFISECCTFRELWLPARARILSPTKVPSKRVVFGHGVNLSETWRTCRSLSSLAKGVASVRVPHDWMGGTLLYLSWDAELFRLRVAYSHPRYASIKRRHPRPDRGRYRGSDDGSSSQRFQRLPIADLYISVNPAAPKWCTWYPLAAHSFPLSFSFCELSIFGKLARNKTNKSIMANDEGEWKPSGRPTSYDC